MMQVLTDVGLGSARFGNKRTSSIVITKGSGCLPTRAKHVQFGWSCAGATGTGRAIRALRCYGQSHNASSYEKKAKMPLPRLALASVLGQAGSPEAAMATVAPLPQLDERALVAEAQSGCRAAFEELVRRYDRDVLRLALNLMKRPEDARDVYQEAFLKVYRNLHRFRFECSFYTWLYRIVTNVCLDHLRRRQARPEDQAPELASSNHDEGIADFFERQREHRPTLDPERQLLGKEIQARLAVAMELLSPRERVVFEMKHYQGLKLRAIGDALGTTEETVKNSLFRATRKLRTHLGELL
jgi:RNA polymerase sigma-70 factor, ECF subfamily